LRTGTEIKRHRRVGCLSANSRALLDRTIRRPRPVERGFR
jgi:hypothetical protein